MEKFNIHGDDIERLRQGYPFTRNISSIVEANTKEEAIEKFKMEHGYVHY